MRVLVCGGRDYADEGILQAVLFGAGITELIHGGCPTGADALADKWAKENGVKVTVFRANWAIYGRAAGPVRNGAMLEFGKPEKVIAFKGGRGTADMVRKALAANIKVVQP